MAESTTAAALSVIVVLTLIYNVASSLPSSPLRPTKNESSVGVGINMEIIHRHSLRSPSYNPNATLLDLAIDMVRRSNLRAQQRHRYRTQDATTPLKPVHGDLLVVFDIGTPQVRSYALLDTGSDFPWVQCLPCKNCYAQSANLYDPKKSQSYTLIKCSDVRCDNQPYIHCNYVDRVTCSYNIEYTDSSRSAGDLAVETFTFVDGTKVTDIIFGCGHENTGSFDEEMSGVIGLGENSISLLGQLKVTKFSFCSAQLSPTSNSSGQLRLGSTAIFSNSRIKMYTRPKGSEDYFLPLEGISLENSGRLQIPANLFLPKQDGSGGFILDTGTYITRLYPEAYKPLISAVAEFIGTEYQRIYDHESTLELCYEGGSWSSFRDVVPEITFHFTGGDYVWKDYGSFYEVESSIWCLPVLMTNDTSIFAAFQMQGYVVGLDLGTNEISFTQALPDCSNP